MKYGIGQKAYGWIFLKMLKRYYKTYMPEKLPRLRKIRGEIQREYGAMVRRTPEIESKSLVGDLVGACFFFALGKVDKEMTPELLDDIVDKSIHSAFMQKAHEKQKREGTLFSDPVQDQKAKEAENSQKSQAEMDWRFTYEKGEQEFRCTYTKCGICTLAKKEHAERFLPCMCRMDYAMYEMVGAKLTRTKTLAAGDDCCNFHVERVKDGE